MAHEAVKEQRQLGIAAAGQLAREVGVSEETVIAAYEAEVARIGVSAAVQQFLHLLAVKHVKAALLARRRSGNTVSSEIDPARRN
jgi:predicted transcriptional regulator